MKNFITSLVAVFGLLIVLGCSGLGDFAAQFQPVEPPSEEWVGQWTGSEFSLTISPNGEVTVNDRRGSAESVYNLPATLWEDDQVVLGANVLTKILSIDEPPYEADGEWRMVVEGVPMTRSAIEEKSLDQLLQELEAVPGNVDGEMQELEQENEALNREIQQLREQLEKEKGNAEEVPAE